MKPREWDLVYEDECIVGWNGPSMPDGEMVHVLEVLTKG